MSMEECFKDLVNNHPGHSELLQTLCSCLQANAVPGFIHVHAPISTRHSQQVIQTLLQRTCSQTGGTEQPFLYSCLNGIECFSARLFYHRVLQAVLTQCKSICGEEPIMPLEDIHPYTSDLDNFLRALRLITRFSRASIIIVIERVERFKEFLPELWTPLSRLDELAGIPISVITISQASWFELRPPDGSAIDPLIINVKPYSKKDSQTFLTALFPSGPPPTTSLSPHHPALKPLFQHFVSTVINICSLSLVDEFELAYITSACWPIFVQPIINQWRMQESPDDDGDVSDLAGPDEDARIRLTRYFTPLIAHALDVLYPRTQHIAQWIRENKLAEDGITLSDILRTPSSVYQLQKPGEGESALSRARDAREYECPPHIRSLTTIAKYILVAAFLASHNPHKSDLRLFARSNNDKGRRRRGGGAVRARSAVGSRAKAKVPQKLLGPMAFPLDRLLAIVGSLMEEHYVERNDEKLDEDDGDAGGGGGGVDDDRDIEMVVGRVQVSATITELVNQGLLSRIAPAPEKVDLETTMMSYKCAIDQSCAFALARDVGIGSLVDWMYDAEG